MGECGERQYICCYCGRETGQKFIAQKVPSQCPLVLLIKVGRRQGEEASVVGIGLLVVRS